MLACMPGGYGGIERADHTLWRCARTLAATEIHRARGSDPARRGDRSRQFQRRIKGIDMDLMSHRDCGQPNNAVLRLRCVRHRTQTKKRAFSVQTTDQGTFYLVEPSGIEPLTS